MAIKGCDSNDNKKMFLMACTYLTSCEYCSVKTDKEDQDSVQRDRAGTCKDAPLCV